MQMDVDPGTGQPVNGTVKGTLTISGKIPSLGATSGTLLVGEISQFGYKAPPISSCGAGEIFEFIFDAKGGDLMPRYYPRKICVVLDAGDSGFSGGFKTSFANHFFSGRSDTFVPAPSTVVMLLSLIGGGLIRKGWRCLSRSRERLVCRE